MALISLIQAGANGVIQVDGEKWKEQRRFTLRTLRDFGLGRALIEERIMSQVELFITHLSMKCDQEVDVCRMHAVCVGNIINHILFGWHFPQVRSCFFIQHFEKSLRYLFYVAERSAWIADTKGDVNLVACRKVS